ncbi:hypothetical protein OY671_007827, partial [Metschnikowia pulcherrima]
ADPRRRRNDVTGGSVSPFASICERAGSSAAASVMNAVVSTAGSSAGNSGRYAATRMLYSSARDGKAPRIFGRVSRNGVPSWASSATTVVAASCFFSFIFSPKAVYIWSSNTSGMTGFIAWSGIAISHYRFRRGYVKQGRNSADSPYVSPFFPFGPIFAFVSCSIITSGQNYQAFSEHRIDWGGVAATYIGIPSFLSIWSGYRSAKGSRFVSYKDMTFPDARARSAYSDSASRGDPATVGPETAATAPGSAGR